MSQCVPNLADNRSLPQKLASSPHSNSLSLAADVSTLDYEVAELTWENGQLGLHGLGLPRMPCKPESSSTITKYIWDKPRAGETLEAIVNQAKLLPHSKSKLARRGDELVPWVSGGASGTASATITSTMDALVPCTNIRRDEHSAHVVMPPGNGTGAVGSSTGVGSCSVEVEATYEMHRLARGTGGAGAQDWSSRDHSGSGSDTIGLDSRQVTFDTCDKGTQGFTSTSMGSPGNTSSGKKSTTGDDHDSACHSRPQREEPGENDKKKGKGKCSLLAKRSRAAAIHNQSERKRRDKINQRMKTLQKLVPNASKTDKASMLDEVIEYLKQLQAQIQMVGRMNMSSLMMPLAMQQQLQMSLMNPMGMAGMGMGMGMPGMGIGAMDLNTVGRSNMVGMPPVMHPSAFMQPLASWDGYAVDRMPNPASPMPDPMSTFLACQPQAQPMTMEAYSRMAAMFQQQMQPPAPASKN